MSQGSTEDTRDTEIEMLITHRSWRKYLACLQGPHGEIRAGCRQGEAGSRARDLGSRAGARRVHSHLKNGFWFGPRGSV